MDADRERGVTAGAASAELGGGLDSRVSPRFPKIPSDGGPRFNDCAGKTSVNA
jgi:hypothetical protein